MGRSFIAAMLLLLASAPASAHGWYDPFCCSGRDCAPIPFDAVTITEDGYLVTLGPGDHLMVRTQVEHVAPYGEVRESRDDRFHACLFPDETVLRCLYAPPFGS